MQFLLAGVEAEVQKAVASVGAFGGHDIEPEH